MKCQWKKILFYLRKSFMNVYIVNTVAFCGKCLLTKNVHLLAGSFVWLVKKLSIRNRNTKKDFEWSCANSTTLEALTVLYVCTFFYYLFQGVFNYFRITTFNCISLQTKKRTHFLSYKSISSDWLLSTLYKTLKCVFVQ